MKERPGPDPEEQNKREVEKTPLGHGSRTSDVFMIASLAAALAGAVPQSAEAQEVESGDRIELNLG